MDEKSNEITAIPQLLKALEIEGCIVTIDAMGCQRTIAQQIVERGAAYVLALKGNQGRLFEAVQQIFAQSQKTQFLRLSLICIDIGHGRVENSSLWTIKGVGPS